MTEALWIKRGGALVPCDPMTEQMIASVGQGVYVRTDPPRRPRNPDFHRLMMAILQQVLEHTYQRFADIEELMDWLKLKSGMVKEIEVEPGLVKLKFKSVSFAAMDQIKFKAICQQWLDLICTELMPGTDPETLLDEAKSAA